MERRPPAHSPLTLHEEQRLLASVRTGDWVARNRIIMANVGLVKSLASRYCRCGVPPEDLVHEGYLGLIRAIDRFQPMGKIRLATYATWWIRHYLRRAVARQSQSVHLPSAVLGSLRSLGQTSSRLRSILGREPDSREISQNMGRSVSHIRTLQHVQGGSIPIHQAEDFLCDSNQPTPLEHLVRHSLHHEIGEWLDRLPPREARILRLRYGLDKGKPLNCKETGKRCRLCGERVRQIELQALRRLRTFL
jgi:RNA polymerase primary sigma factor